MSEENSVLLFIFLFVILINVIGFVFLRHLLRKKYKFPTQIPPPFFGAKEFSVFLEERTTLPELCHKRTVGLNEFVPSMVNGNSSLPGKNLRNISNRTEIIPTTGKDFRQELGKIDDNQSMYNGEVVVSLSLQQNQKPVAESTLNVHTKTLSKNGKELSPGICEDISKVVFEKEEYGDLKKENKQVTGELDQVYKNLAAVEVLIQCPSESKCIDQNNKLENTQISDLQFVQMKATKENFKKNPQQLMSKKKKRMKGQLIFKKWQEKKSQPEEDLSSSLRNEGSIPMSEDEEICSSATEEKLVLKVNKNQLDYIKQNNNEKQQKQNDLLVVRNYFSNSERQSSVKDDKEFSQNSQEEFLRNSEKPEILQRENNKIEISENFQRENVPMLLRDQEKFLHNQHLTTEYIKQSTLDKYKNISEVKQEEFQIFQGSHVEHQQWPLTIKEDISKNSQILDSQNINSFEICPFSDIKKELDISENNKNGRSDAIPVNNSDCYSLNLSLRKDENSFLLQSDIEKMKSSMGNISCKDTNSFQANLMVTKPEHQLSLNIDYEQSISINDNKQLKSKQPSEADQCPGQNLFSTNSTSQEFTPQFPNEGTDVGFSSSWQNTRPEKCNASNIDMVGETKLKSVDIQNFITKSVDNIKSSEKNVQPGIYYPQQSNDSSLPLDCKPFERSVKKNNTYSNLDNLSTNISIPGEFNYSPVNTNSKTSNISKYNQNLQIAYVVSEDDGTTFYPNTFSTNDSLQKSVLFSSNLHRSKKLQQTKQTCLPLTDLDSKLIQNSKFQTDSENTKDVPDFGDDYKQLSPGLFSETIPKQDLKTELLEFQPPPNNSNNVIIPPEHKLFVNLIAKESNETPLVKVKKKTKLLKKNVWNQKSISNNENMSQHAFSEISKIEESESSADILHPKKKLRGTKSPELLNYFTRSITHMLVLAEDVSEEQEKEEEFNQCLKDEESTLINVIKASDDLPKFKEVVWSTEDKTSLSAQKMPKAHLSKGTNCSHKPIKKQSKSDNHLINFDEVSMKEEELIPQVYKTQILNTCISNNVQSNEKIPNLKQVHWLPGYVLPSPILSDPIPEESNTFLAIKSATDNDIPKSGILKSTYRNLDGDALSSAPSEIRTDSKALEDSLPQPRILRKSQNPFGDFSQYGHPQEKMTYWNDDYRNQMYPKQRNHSEPSYIYSLQKSSPMSSSAKDRNYSTYKCTRYDTPDKFLSRYESCSFDCEKPESFTYENMNSSNGKQKATSNSLDSEFSHQNSSFVSPLESHGNNTSKEPQREAKEYRSHRTALFHQNHTFSPLKNLGRPDYHQSSPRYLNYLKWLNIHFKPRYPVHIDEEYEDWSYKRYCDYLTHLWYKEKYCNHYQERYMNPWPQLDYQKWCYAKWWEDYLRYWDEWWAWRNSDKFKGYWENCLDEYSMYDYGKYYFDTSVSKQNKEKHDKRQYTKTDKVKERQEMRDNRFAIRYKEKDEKTVFKSQERTQVDGYRHRENYWEEQHLHKHRQKCKDDFITPRDRNRSRENYFVSNPRDCIYRDDLEGSLTYYEDYWERERYWNNLYRFRSRERHCYDWPEIRSSERSRKDLSSGKYKRKY